MIKKMLILTMLVSLSFGGSKKKIRLLQEEVDTLQSRNVTLLADNQKLEAEKQQLVTRYSGVDAKLKGVEKSLDSLRLKNTILNNKIKQYEALTGTGSSTPSSTMTYPLTGSILRKKRYDQSNVEMHIAFLNNSTKSLQGFTANVKFYEGTMLLNECVIEVKESMPAGENVTWYGAIPFNSSRAEHVRFYNIEANKLRIIMEVKSVIDNNGIVKQIN